MKRLLILLVVLLFCLGGGLLFFRRAQPEEVQVSQEVQEITAALKQKPEIKEEQEVKEKQEEPVLDTEEKVSTIEVEPVVQLDVPFIVQAPNTDWSERYKEACEEASILMVHKYYQGSGELTQDEMKSLIDPLADWGDMTFDGRVDTSIKETSLYLTEYLGYDVSRMKFLENPSIDDIKALLAKGLPVVVPAAGRELGNKFFQTPGPLYHMLVITGYDNKHFVTNDPGTRRGEGYRYDQEVLLQAIHDWTGTAESILEGKKIVLVVTP